MRGQEENFFFSSRPIDKKIRKDLLGMLPVIFLLFFLSCSGLNWSKFATSNEEEKNTSLTVLGVIDTSFGGNGYVVHDNAAGGNGNDVGNAITIDSLGRIVVTGSSSNGVDRDMAIWRYHSDGTLDTTFNGVGYVTHHNASGGNGNDFGEGIAIDPSGKIVVVGESINAAGDYDMVIWRYNPDGSLDTTFNGVGYVVHHNASGGNGSDLGYAVVIDSSGKILVTGESFGTGKDMVIWRYNPDGTLDTTFNSPKGFVVYNGTGDDVGYDITIDSNGKILVVGYSYNSTTLTQDMAIWRYHSDGTLDTTFNGVGYVTHNNAAGGNGNDFGRGIAIDPSGKILVTGYGDRDPTAGINNDMVIWRYNLDGTLDTTFNGVGYVTHNNATGANQDDIGEAITIDSQGRILVTGYSDRDPNNTINNYDMIIWRYHPDGSLDTSFGNGEGYIFHDNAAGGNGSDVGYDITIDSLGRILVTGYSDRDPTATTNLDMIIWRYK